MSRTWIQIKINIVKFIWTGMLKFNLYLGYRIFITVQVRLVRKVYELVLLMLQWLSIGFFNRYKTETHTLGKWWVICNSEDIYNDQINVFFLDTNKFNIVKDALIHINNLTKLLIIYLTINDLLLPESEDVWLIIYSTHNKQPLNIYFHPFYNTTALCYHIRINIWITLY